jgi:hypothetical protein
MAKEKDPSEHKGEQINVTSHHQSGGITAHTVTVLAPQPGVSGHVEYANRLSGDAYETKIVIAVEAPYAAKGIEAIVEGTSIKELRFGPVGGGVAFNVTTYDSKPEQIAIHIDAPLAAAYQAFIYTTQLEDPTFQVRLR